MPDTARTLPHGAAMHTCAPRTSGSASLPSHGRNASPRGLDGGSRGRNGVGDGCSSGDGDVRGRMAEGMRAGAQAERADAVDARLWILHNDDNKSIIQSPKGA